MKPAVAGCIFAAAFWFLIFSPWTAGAINFWGAMTGASGFLAAYGLFVDRANLRAVYLFRPMWMLTGLLSAVLLYGIFFVGDRISTLLFEFAVPQVTGIYGTKTQAAPALIGALLFFWIGPGEEIFWRGFVQRRFGQKLGEKKGYIVTSLVYALIHLWALNFMLFMAALVCGLFWGWMFLKYKSAWPCLMSHAAWDLTIFVLLPIR